MNTLMVKVLRIGITATFVAGAVACSGGGAGAGSALGGAALSSSAGGASDAAGASVEQGVRYAQVVRVDPVREAGVPRQVCHDETVTHTAPPKDQHRIAGTAIGAVAGGLLGNQVGGGKGRTLATVAGAVGGGYAGNRIEANHQHGQVTTSVQRRCTTVNEASDRIVGYDVQYQYNGVTRTVRMDHDPGDRVQIQQGATGVSDAR